ncbi:MAG: HAD family phosphatase [Erysipelotrichaceae bacterium]|nr:HAD family phosphatase [Erysipelotrichaceae bacterium]
MIRNVIFDLDGTLLDTEYRAITIKKDLLANHGIEPTEELMLKLTARKLKDVLPGLLEDRQLVREVLDDYYHFAYDGIDYGRLCLPGSDELLRKLKADGHTLALATISDRKKVDQVISQCHWEGLFSYITTLDDVSRSKPDPEIYLTVLERLGLDPQETVVIEDSLIGIQAAHDAGLKVICRRERRMPMPQPDADWYIDDLREAVALIENL